MDLKINKKWSKQQGYKIKKQKIKMAESKLNNMVKTFKAVSCVETLIRVDWDFIRELHIEYDECRYNNHYDDEIIEEFYQCCLDVIHVSDNARKSVDSKALKRMGMDFIRRL